MPLIFNPDAGKREYLEGTITAIRESGSAIEYSLVDAVNKVTGREPVPTQKGSMRLLVFSPKVDFGDSLTAWIGHMKSAFTIMGKTGGASEDIVKDLQPLVGQRVRFYPHTYTFTGKDGVEKETTWYTLKGTTPTVAGVEDIVELLAGKTVFEALRMRSTVVGTPYEAMFANRTTLLKEFEGKLVLNTTTNKFEKVS